MMYMMITLILSFLLNLLCVNEASLEQSANKHTQFNFPIVEVDTSDSTDEDFVPQEDSPFSNKKYALSPSYSDISVSHSRYIQEDNPVRGPPQFSLST